MMQTFFLKVHFLCPPCGIRIFPVPMRDECRNNCENRNQCGGVTGLPTRKHRKPAEKFDACADHAKGARKRYSLAREAGAERSDIEKLAETALYKDKCHNDATDS